MVLSLLMLLTLIIWIETSMATVLSAKEIKTSPATCHACHYFILKATFRAIAQDVNLCYSARQPMSLQKPGQHSYHSDDLAITGKFITYLNLFI